jgi:sortase A
MVVGGLAIFSVAGYSEFVQPYFSAQEQQRAAAGILDEFEESAESSIPDSPNDRLEIGELFAVMYAPRLAEDFRRPIGEGTNVEKVLNTVGIGHYLHSAMPHEPGNFALAAHRTTFGGAFNHIDRFVAGDKIYIETRWGWYTYEMVESKVVDPKAFWVVGENPLKAGGRWLTLTTCTPRYTTEDRLIVWAKLVAETSRAQGAPAEIAELVASNR